MHIVLSLVLTLVLYSLFPFLFAWFKKKPITLFRYRAVSFLFNFVLHILFNTIGVFSSTANILPMILWTTVATIFGKLRLEANDLLAQ